MPTDPLIPAPLELGPEGVPRSTAYGDVYHSIDGGPGQARHVFLAGNGLPERWRDRQHFVILETGFGTGLNFLATWAAWREDPAACRNLHYLAVEKHPFRLADLQRLHARWPEFTTLASELRAQWPVLVPGYHRLELAGGRLRLTLLLGDIRTVLPQLHARIDALYLDGFAPARNPDIWSPEVYKRLGRLCATGASVATWSVAGVVRAGLAAVGFQVEKRPGFGGKREMLSGRFMPAPWQAPPPREAPPAERAAIVLGAGLAGAACAERLASRGWQLTLIDRQPGPAGEASGNLAGIYMPLVSRDDNIASRLSRAAFLYAPRLWRQLAAAGQTPRFDPCGVLQLARDARQAHLQQALADTQGYPEDYLRYLDPEQAAALAGAPLTAGGWLFPQGGWANPPSLCQALLRQAGPNLHCLYGRDVVALERRDGLWHTLDATGGVLAAAPVLILASGAEAARLRPELPIQRVRGQVSLLPEDSLPPIRLALCREGYATPAVDGLHAVGASYGVEDPEPMPRPEEDLDNLSRLSHLVPQAAWPRQPHATAARVGFRAVAPDRLPLVGPLADPAARDVTQLQALPRVPGLHALLGLASRGLIWHALLAELLASRLDAEPWPVETDLADAVDPGRFLLKRLRRQG